MEATLQQFDAFRIPGRTICGHVDGLARRMAELSSSEDAPVLQSYGKQLVNSAAWPFRSSSPAFSAQCGNSSPTLHRRRSGRRRLSAVIVRKPNEQPDPPAAAARSGSAILRDDHLATALGEPRARAPKRRLRVQTAGHSKK